MPRPGAVAEIRPETAGGQSRAVRRKRVYQVPVASLLGVGQVGCHTHDGVRTMNCRDMPSLAATSCRAGCALIGHQGFQRVENDVRPRIEDELSLILDLYKPDPLVVAFGELPHRGNAHDRIVPSMHERHGLA